MEALIEALQQGDEDRFTQLIEQSYLLIEEKNKLLRLAVIKGNIKIVDTLLKQGAEINHAYQPMNISLQQAIELAKPLIVVAAEQNNILMIRLLIKNRANIQAQDAYGSTALLLAAAAGYEDIVQYLFTKGANPDIANICGETPASQAVRNNHSNIVEILANHHKNKGIIFAESSAKISTHPAGLFVLARKTPCAVEPLLGLQQKRPLNQSC